MQNITQLIVDELYVKWDESIGILIFIRSVTYYKSYHNNNINYHMTRNAIFSVVVGYGYLITFSFHFFDTIFVYKPHGGTLVSQISWSLLVIGFLVVSDQNRNQLRTLERVQDVKIISMRL